MFPKNFLPSGSECHRGGLVAGWDIRAGDLSGGGCLYVCVHDWVWPLPVACGHKWPRCIRASQVMTSSLAGGWRVCWDLLVTVSRSSFHVGAKRTKSGAFLGAVHRSTVVVIARIEHHAELVGQRHLTLHGHGGCLLDCGPCAVTCGPVHTCFCMSARTERPCQAAWEQATSPWGHGLLLCTPRTAILSATWPLPV